MSFKRSMVRRALMKTLPKSKKHLLNRLTRVAVHVSIKTASQIVGSLIAQGMREEIKNGKTNSARP